MGRRVDNMIADVMGMGPAKAAVFSVLILIHVNSSSKGSLLNSPKNIIKTSKSRSENRSFHIVKQTHGKFNR